MEAIKKNSDHISQVALEQLIYIYPAKKEKIIEWFSGCTIKANSEKWRRLEILTLEKLMEMIE